LGESRETVRARTARGDRVASLAILAVVLAVVAALHAPGVAGTFLSDDFGALTHLHREDAAGTLGRWLAARFVAPMEGMSAAYRPLGFASFALDWRLHGAHATGWHVTSLLLHLANAVLVYVVVQRWLRDVPGRAVTAALAAALFAAFPFVGELTSWAAARFDLLAATFGLAFLATLDGARAGPARHAARAALLLAALLSKESAVPLVAVALLVDAALCREPAQAHGRERAAFALRDMAPALVVLAAYLGWRYALFGSALKVYPNSGPPGSVAELGQRLATLGTMATRQVDGVGGWWPLACAALLGIAIAAASVAPRAAPPARRIALACALAAGAYLVLPSLSLPAIEATGTGARNHYLAWVFAAVALASVASATLAARLAVAFLAGVLLLGQAANLALWQGASREMKAVTRAIPAFADAIPADGYAILLLPDSVGPALFARNSQSALVAPPVQERDHLDRVVAMTAADFADWRGHLRGDTIARLKRAPSFDPGRFAGVYCWSPASRAFVRVGRPGAVVDLDQWEREIRANVPQAGCLRGTL